MAAAEEARSLQEQHEREAADEEAKALADWRGPKWWLGERVYFPARRVVHARESAALAQKG